MKTTFRAAALLLLAAVFALAGCRESVTPGEETGEGETHMTGKDGPEDGKKTVWTEKSLPKEAPDSELIYFDCRFANDVSEELGWGFFELHAEKTEGGAEGSYCFREQNGVFVSLTFPFKTGGELLRECRRILEESGVFADNGTREVTEGIPEDLGFEVDARYENGARLSVSDNAATRFGRETVEALAALFSRASGAEAFYDTEDLIAVNYDIYERDKYHFSADIYRTPEGKTAYRIYEKDGSGSTSDKGETDGRILSKIEMLWRENRMESIQDFPRREGDVYYTLNLAFGKRQERAASNTAISDEQLEALKSIRETILASLAG